MGTRLGSRDAEFSAKLVWFLRVLDRLFGIDFSAIYELGEVGIQLNHSVFCSGLEVRFDEIDFIFPDQVRNGWGVDHDLESCDSTTASLAHKDLGDNSHDGGGELGPDHLLSVSGKGIDDAGDGAGGSGGVESAEDQVTGFGGGDGGFDRLEVTHFAHEDDIGILAEGAADRLGKAGDVDMNFPLGDDAFFVGMIVLDRVLDRDDVGLSVLVDPVHHGGEGGGFSRSGGTGDQDQAAGAGEEGLDGGGEADLVHREQTARDEAENEAVVSLGFEDTDAEAGIIPKRYGKISPTLPVESLLQRRGQNVRGDFLRMFRGEGWALVGDHLARDTQDGGLTDLKMEIGGSSIHDGSEKGSEIGCRNAHKMCYPEIAYILN